MSRNPYSPPQTSVAEPPLETLPRPRAVVVATWMLWISFALGVTSWILELDGGDEDYPLWLQGVILMIEAGTSVLLNVKIWQGRNWARIVALILSLVAYLAWAFFMATDPEFVAEVSELGWLYGAQAVLDVAALVLIFGPGRAWFRRRARAG